jgi:hypothetical protein
VSAAAASRLAAAAATAVVGAAAIVAVAGHAAEPRCSWAVVVRGDWYHGVAAASATAVWGVGITGGAAPVAGRWNGRAWERVPVPTQPGGKNVLWAVAARSPGEAWAVGWVQTTGDSGPGAVNLVVRWLRNRWAIVAVPTPGAEAQLQHVVFVGDREVWVAGRTFDVDDQGRSLLLRWDGARWRSLALPDPVAGEITGLASAGATVWIAGKDLDPQTGSPTTAALVQRQRGVWRTVRTMREADDARVGFGPLDATAAGNVWTVERRLDGIRWLRWDGRRWSAGPTQPLPATRNPMFLGLATTSPSDAWLVGEADDVTGRIRSGFRLHFDGRRSLAVPGPPDGTFYAVDGRSPQDVWTVGNSSVQRYRCT